MRTSRRVFGKLACFFFRYKYRRSSAKLPRGITSTRAHASANNVRIRQSQKTTTTTTRSGRISLAYMSPKNLSGIPRGALAVGASPVPFVFSYQKRERACETRGASGAEAFAHPSRSLSYHTCVFYCKLRLKSLARGQAFHLGRRIPADAHGHARYTLFAYVSWLM